MPIREFTYVWTGAGSAPKNTILHGAVEGELLGLPLAWRGLMEARKAGLAAPMTGRFESEVRVIDETTGALIGTEALTESYISTFTGTDPLPDATQGLLRFRTGLIRNGRRVQGRAFIPGIVRLASVAGNNGDAAAWTNDAAALPLSPLVVWSRPGPAGAGVAAQVTSVDCWTEFAVLRRRRA